MDWVKWIVGFFLAAVVVGAMAAFVIRMLRGLLLAVRDLRGLKPQYVRVEDPYPAPPVVLGGGIRLVAVLVLVWSALHLGLAVAWAATGAILPRIGTWILAASYAVASSVIAGIGAVLLLGGSRRGRKLVTWGEFLLCVVAFVLAAVCLTLPTSPQASDALRRWGYVLAAVFGVHVIIDTTLGTLAQRLARPRGWSDAAGRVVRLPSEEDALPPA